MSLPISRMEDTKIKSAGIAAFLKAEVEPRHGDIILFACCLSSGLVDSTIYNGKFLVPPTIHLNGVLTYSIYSI